MDKKQKKTPLPKKRILLIVIITAAILVALGLMVSWIVSNQGKDEPVSSQSEKEKDQARAKQAEADSNLQKEAAKQITANNTVEAEKLYQKAVDAAETIERKTLLYIDLSAVYYSEGKYNEAFAIAKKAEALNSDKFLVADWLSRLYEDRQDYKNAETYYLLAGEWAESQQNKTGITKETYDREADRVSNLAKKAGQ